jgi:nitrate/nitrite transport system substrate-binding protein
MKISRRKFIRTAALTATAAAVSSFPMQFAFASAPRKIRIGVIAPSHCALSMIHASITGRYKKNGVDAEIVYLPDALDIAKALISGEIQVGQIMSPVFFAINAGTGPFKGSATPVVTAQTGGTNGGVLVAGINSGIIQAKDLAGKKIGVHSPLMVHSLLINKLLKKNNIDPEKGVTTRDINMPELIQALSKGDIDAFINPEPLATAAISKGAAKEIMISKALWFRHPCCFVAVRKDMYVNDRDTVKALYLSSLESGLLLNRVDTRTDALTVVHKEAKPYSQLTLSAMLKAFTPGRTDFDPFPFQSSGRAILTMMKESRLMPGSVDAQKTVSETMLSDLARELLKKLGDTPPAENSRQEKIVGEIVT